MTRQPTGVFTPSTDKRGQGRKNYRIAGEKLRRSLEKKTRKNTDTPRRQDLTRGVIARETNRGKKPEPPGLLGNGGGVAGPDYQVVTRGGRGGRSNLLSTGRTQTENGELDT